MKCFMFVAWRNLLLRGVLMKYKSNQQWWNGGGQREKLLNYKRPNCNSFKDIKINISPSSPKKPTVYNFIHKIFKFMSLKKSFFFAYFPLFFLVPHIFLINDQKSAPIILCSGRQHNFQFFIIKNAEYPRVSL